MDNTEQMNETLRIHATDLAHRINFLREEMKKGDSLSGYKEECANKILELGKLFPNVQSNVLFLEFEIKDSYEKPISDYKGEAPNRSAQLPCLRQVQILNPNRLQNANGVRNISLLSKTQAVSKKNLENMGRSEILPKAYGGI